LPCKSPIQKKSTDGFFLGHTPDWKGREAVAVVGELVEPQAMEAKAGSRNEVSSDPGKRVTIWHEGRF